MNLEIAVATLAGIDALDGNPKLRENTDRYLIQQFTVSNETIWVAAVATIQADYICKAINPIASQIVINTLITEVENNFQPDPVDTLKNAFQKAAKQMPKVNNIYCSATSVAAIIRDEKLFIVSCGDSRMMLLRNNKIVELAPVHTFVQTLIDFGHTTPEEVWNLPHYNKKPPYRALSNLDTDVVDLRLRLKPDDNEETGRTNQGMKLRVGDQLLLLSSVVFRDYIAPPYVDLVPRFFFGGNLTAQEAVNLFIDERHRRNPYGNKTALLLRVKD